MNKLIIEKSNLTNNIDIIKKMADGTPIIAVIKCNGYGLGLIEYANFLLESGIEIFGVSTLEEAVALRNAGIKNEIILLTSISIDKYAKIILENNIIATIGSQDAAFALARAGSDLNIIPKAHIEIDTGMGRCGFSPSDINIILSLKNLPIEFCGSFTHFSFSFSNNKKDVDDQLNLFLKTVKTLNENGFTTGILHASNSCSFLQYKDTHLDAARVGSAFLGRIPINNSYGLKSVGYLQSEVIEINNIKKGNNIGYGNTYKAKSDIKTAIIPVGYAHGFMTEKSRDTFRLLDILRFLYHDLKPKKYYCQIGNDKVQIIGRIGMFNIICDVTNTNVKAGDIVKLKVNPILLDNSVVREYV